MRDAFAVLFFVSVGMLFDPRSLLETPGLISITFAIVVVAKPLAALGIMLLMGYPPKVALTVSVALAQIGEFSFMLAALGRSLNLLPETATNVLVATAIASISLNPLFYRLIAPLEAWASRRPRIWRWLTSRAPEQASAGSVGSVEDDSTEGSRFRAVVVGYGPVGRTLTRLLRDNDIKPTIIEMNLETVQSLRAEGLLAVYGDAARRETLQSAGVDRAGTLILSASTIPAASEVIRMARELNPKIRILARTSYLRERAALRQAGADSAYSGEGEVALAMTESVLRALGAIPEQIDRERARVRADLFTDH